MPRRALILDLDGTLVETIQDIHAAVNHAFARLGHDFAPDEVRGFVGEGAPVLIGRAMAARGLAGEGLQRDLLAAFLAFYRDHPADRSHVFPGVAAALERLRARGHALVICTNKPEVPAHGLLRALDLARFFPVVIGGDSLPRRKPDPLPAREALRRSGAEAGLFIGDSEVDAATAQAAGMPFILFTQGYRKTPLAQIVHAAAFDSHDLLPDLVRQLDP